MSEWAMRWTWIWAETVSRAFIHPDGGKQANTREDMLTRDLKKSTDNLVVHGKLIINLSTNMEAPPRNNIAPSLHSNASRPSLTSPQGSIAPTFSGLTPPLTHNQRRPSNAGMADGSPVGL